MTFFEPFFEFDRWLFYIINVKGGNAVFDAVMPFITDFSNFAVPLVLIWLALLIFGGRKGRVAAVMVAVWRM
jgi:hypothetical protein